MKVLNERDLDISNATDAQKKRALACAIEVRKSEIDRFWSRTIVFWGFVAATFVAFGALYKETQNDYLPILIISCFGFVSSLAWSLQNRGSKYWQEAWEHKVKTLEYDVMKIELFSNRERLQNKGLWGANRASVSKLVVAMSDLAVLVWFVLASNTYYRANPIVFSKLADLGAGLMPSLTTAIAIFSVGYTIAILTRARSN